MVLVEDTGLSLRLKRKFIKYECLTFYVETKNLQNYRKPNAKKYNND